MFTSSLLRGSCPSESPFWRAGLRATSRAGAWWQMAFCPCACPPPPPHLPLGPQSDLCGTTQRPRALDGSPYPIAPEPPNRSHLHPQRARCAPAGAEGHGYTSRARPCTAVGCCGRPHSTTTEPLCMKPSYSRAVRVACVLFGSCHHKCTTRARQEYGRTRCTCKYTRGGGVCPARRLHGRRVSVVRRSRASPRRHSVGP